VEIYSKKLEILQAELVKYIITFRNITNYYFVTDGLRHCHCEAAECGCGNLTSSNDRDCFAEFILSKAKGPQ